MVEGPTPTAKVWRRDPKQSGTRITTESKIENTKICVCLSRSPTVCFSESRGGRLISSAVVSLFRTTKLVGWLVGWYLWHINFVGYLTPNSVYMYIHSTKDFLANNLSVKFSISRISFVCTWLNSFNSSHFWSNPVSLKKDRTSSILTFSNRSVKLFTLKNRFLITAKALYSIRTCLTE